MAGRVPARVAGPAAECRDRRRVDLHRAKPGGPTLLYALLLGMALNPIAMEGKAKAGVDLAARNILRIGVALLGARITFEQIGTLGWQGAALVALGSVGLIPPFAAAARGDGARGCLVVAIAAVGLKTSPLEMKRVGLRAFALLVIETAALAVFVLGAQLLLTTVAASAR